MLKEVLDDTLIFGDKWLPKSRGNRGECLGGGDHYLGDYILAESSVWPDDGAGRPWLPKGLEFLSGLPEAARRRRNLFEIQAFIDDSGVKGTDAVFVLAGFIAPAEQWATFSSAWEMQLKASPSIRYLKMNEAARSSPSGEFRGWSSDAIQAKLKGFTDIIKAYAQRAIYVAIDLAAHADIHPEGVHKDPYFLAFYSILSGVCFDCLDQGVAEEIDVIFDEQVIFGPRVALWYPAVREALEHRGGDYSELAKVLPASPSFRDDEKFLPLQASDILGWLFRHALSGNRNDFEWIGEELMPTIPMSSYASLFTAERMRHQVEMGSLIEYPAEFLRKWQHILTPPPRKPKRRRETDERTQRG